MAKGVRPAGRMNIGYQYGYLYVAINPLLGEAFGLILPNTKIESLDIFIKEFRSWLAGGGIAEETTRIILDGAGSHKSEKIDCGELEEELLPPYSPKLNPVERFFQELRRKLKNKVFESYQAVEQAVEAAFRDYLEKPEAVKKPTNFSWLQNATT